MRFLSSWCPLEAVSSHGPPDGASTCHDPSTSSCSTTARKLGRVRHSGFKPPGNFLSPGKFLPSSHGLWLICTIRGMSQNPTTAMLCPRGCCEGCLDSALNPCCTNITVHAFRSYLPILDEELRQELSFLRTRSVWSWQVDGLLPIQMRPCCAYRPEYPPLAQFYLDELLFYFSYFFCRESLHAMAHQLNKY